MSYCRNCNREVGVVVPARKFHIVAFFVCSFLTSGLIIIPWILFYLLAPRPKLCGICRTKI